jgi:hypothetical protein
MCNLAGQALRQWSMKERVNDLVLTPDAQVIVCVTADRFIELMRLKDYVPVSHPCIVLNLQWMHGSPLVGSLASRRYCLYHLVRVP